MLPTMYLANPHEILQTITQGRHQHIVEEVYGVMVVVGGSTWTLSSWFGPPNARWSLMAGVNGAVVMIK
jgi:hypothetical protein